MPYIVKVGFDEEERRYFVKHSEIPGLNVEAETFEEFVDVASDLAPDLLASREVDFVIRFEREVVVAA